MFEGLTVLSSLASATSLSCILIINQELMKHDIKWYKTCKCKCRLEASVCNKKQRWNDDANVNGNVKKWLIRV